MAFSMAQVVIPLGARSRPSSRSSASSLVSAITREFRCCLEDVLRVIVSQSPALAGNITLQDENLVFESIDKCIFLPLR